MAGAQTWSGCHWYVGDAAGRTAGGPGPLRETRPQKITGPPVPKKRFKIGL